MRLLYSDCVCVVYQLVKMSVTGTNLIDGIRVDRATQKGSVYDVIHIVSGKQENYASQAFARIKKTNPEITPKCCRLKIDGKGHVTPVADAATLVEIAWLVPGKAAAAFRRKGAESVCRLLGGDLQLVDEIQRRHAQVTGTAEEEFLLAGSGGNIGSSAQVALPALPYSLEQLQQMQTAAAAIAASAAGVQQCTLALNELPMAKYTRYIELKGQEIQLKGQEIQLKGQDLGLDERRFGLTQKQDEHSLRMDRERAELEDRTAKRRRFNAGTDEGITFRSLLAKAAEGVSDAKGFEQKARELSLGLDVYNAFKQHVTGNHKPLQYNTEVAEAIAKFIKESVDASSKGAAKDLRSYFNAVPRASTDTGDLYDSS